MGNLSVEESTPHATTRKVRRTRIKQPRILENLRGKQHVDKVKKSGGGKSLLRLCPVHRPGDSARSEAEVQRRHGTRLSLATGLFCVVLCRDREYAKYGV